MKLFLPKLVDRLKQYSHSLDKKEIFVEIPWVYIAPDGVRYLYIFQRTGELLISRNGIVNTGSWQLLSQARSLLINRTTDTILLNQGFIDEAVMVLRLDGTDENVVLANENKIPDLDVPRYLNEKYKAINRIVEAPLPNGEVIELHAFEGYLPYIRITKSGEAVEDGKILVGKNCRTAYVKDSRITHVFASTMVQTKDGILYVFCQEGFQPSKGDKVFLDAECTTVAPDGKYRTGAFWSWRVVNGKLA